MNTVDRRLKDDPWSVNFPPLAVIQLRTPEEIVARRRMQAHTEALCQDIESKIMAVRRPLSRMRALGLYLGGVGMGLLSGWLWWGWR
jgi:hypothetical protein